MDSAAILVGAVLLVVLVPLCGAAGFGVHITSHRPSWRGQVYFH